jgi:LPXTG-motif cell wall-anchored protein
MLLAIAHHHAQTGGSGNGILGFAFIALLVWLWLGRKSKRSTKGKR